MNSDIDFCSCGSGDLYAECCGRFIEGHESAQTAEALMRSRYTAYARLESGYLRETWHPSTRPATLQLDGRAKWIGLKIVRTEQGGRNDDSGIVEFVARYKINGRAFRLHEVSRFVREHDRWFYVDADI